MQRLSSLGSRSGRRLGGRHGTAAVELAVALPVLVLLVLGIADFGRMFFTGIAVANAARAAAEYGARSPDGYDETATNQAGVDDGGDISGLVVTSDRFCKCPDGSSPACSGGVCPAPYTSPEVFVRAYASKTVNLILRYPGIPGSMTFRDSAIFRAN